MSAEAATIMAGSPPGDLTALERVNVRSRMAEKGRTETAASIRKEEWANTVPAPGRVALTAVPALCGLGASATERGEVD